MKKTLLLITLITTLGGCSNRASFPDGKSQYQEFSPDGIPFVITQTPWDVDGSGNHRAVVLVSDIQADAVIATLPWRRPDMRPETKRIIVTNARTGENIRNVTVLELTPETGKIAFQPREAGEYYIYYLPYKFRKRSDDARYGKPWNDYLSPEEIADTDWKANVNKNQSTLPQVKVKQFESRSEFDFFTPMGLIATSEEEQVLAKQAQDGFLIFPEDRAFPIRLSKRLPVRWIEKGSSSEFSGMATKNEYYTWQIGVWAAQKELNNIRLSFSDFASGSHIIQASEATCFNQEGINWDGNPIRFTVNIPAGHIQALGCGLQIPENASPGNYQGTVTLTSDNVAPQTIRINLQVTNDFLTDKGDGELWRHSRLRWLNSTIGTDNLPVTPYTAMQVTDNRITATDKYLTIDGNGLPEAIEINNRPIIRKPFSFIVETSQGPVTFNSENIRIKKEVDGLVSWTASSTQNDISFDCKAYMEYDGYIRYHLKVSAAHEMIVNNIKLITDYASVSSEYFMGTGYSGGKRPEHYTWDWKGPWDSYWMGGPKSGLHVEFRGGTYHGPLINDYKPAPTPVWSNNGNGHILVNGTTVIAQTGKDTLDSVPKDFEFALLVTPVKPANPSKHFSERYYHANPNGFAQAATEGANVANIHHSQNLNPVINYPFIVRDSLIEYINEQHKANRKVKLYYTIRELTNYATEIYALKSLNHEIFVAGVGYGLPWHCEHLIDDYKAAWYTELPGQHSDAALVLNGFSRWINYYLEGLRWMFENYQIDGIYMDDVSFDRTVMKRMKKIMAQYRPNALIDLHSNTGYSIGPANQYTDFFPYVDRLWFGESFKYNQMRPDEWFVTFSGIPFGQMSEMLQDGGNRYLGMVYGTTARHSYGQFSPAPVWALWKSFGITEANMLGYWDNDCPVRSNHPDVKVTVYVKPQETLLAIGNFDTKDQTIKLDYNWITLGIDPSKAILYAPEIADFQQEHTFGINESIPVSSKKGWLLIVKEKK